VDTGLYTWILRSVDGVLVDSIFRMTQSLHEIPLKGADTYFALVSSAEKRERVEIMYKCLLLHDERE